MDPRRSAAPVSVVPKLARATFAKLQLLSTAPYKISNSNELPGLKFWDEAWVLLVNSIFYKEKITPYIICEPAEKSI